jgi:hypothetical protein
MAAMPLQQWERGRRGGRRTFTYMADYVTKDQLKSELKFALDGAVQTIISEMGVRLGEVNQRLDRMDATLVNHGKQLASGAQAIAGFKEWVGG